MNNIDEFLNGDIVLDIKNSWIGDIHILSDMLKPKCEEYTYGGSEKAHSFLDYWDECYRQNWVILYATASDYFSACRGYTAIEMAKKHVVMTAGQIIDECLEFKEIKEDELASLFGE